MLGEGFLDVFSIFLLNELSFVISLASSLSLLSPFFVLKALNAGGGFHDVFSNLCASVTPRTQSLSSARDNGHTPNKTYQPMCARPQ